MDGLTEYGHGELHMLSWRVCIVTLKQCAEIPSLPDIALTAQFTIVEMESMSMHSNNLFQRFHLQTVIFSVDFNLFIPCKIMLQ